MNFDDVPPVIVTARMDAAAQVYFDALRTAHFPVERNYLKAHLTLFHKLPGAELPRIQAVVQSHDSLFPMSATATAPYSIGNGVAIAIECAALKQLHRDLSATWLEWLTPQDRQGSKKGLKSHVTVQNKVTADAAQALLATLTANFTPFDFTITGLDLWHYLGGPWAAVQ